MREQPAAVEDLELGIETIRRRSEGLLKFTETYRNLNKIVAPTVSKVYIRNLFENLHQLMQPTLQQKNVELDIILQNPDLSYELDATLIEQVLINLLVNALEATPGGGQLFVALRRRGEMAEIEIRDTGRGIAPEHRQRIFQLFFTTRPGGSGIGLASTFRTVQLHNGSIAFDSEVGRGTTFRIGLPLARQTEAALSRPREPGAAVARSV
jgi:signal transduction histidine kinase